MGALEAMTLRDSGHGRSDVCALTRGTRVARERFVSHAVVDDQNKSANPVDDGGPFVHACYCGRWGFFGFEVALLKDRTGRVLRRASSGRRGSEFTEGTTMKLATATVLAVLWAGPAAAARPSKHY